LFQRERMKAESNIYGVFLEAYWMIIVTSIDLY
jgi:hypothetical protein